MDSLRLEEPMTLCKRLFIHPRSASSLDNLAQKNCDPALGVRAPKKRRTAQPNNTSSDEKQRGRRASIAQALQCSVAAKVPAMRANATPTQHIFTLVSPRAAQTS